MRIRHLTGEEGAKASAALEASFEETKERLRDAGATSFEAVYIDDDGEARSAVRGDDDE
ncbi:hypothetical protein [Arenimonas daejeonensis]|uniref:hypothetical protein n=1 Tax=Arenimonas daejeonensis TaxID=370777 RepID=UPI001D154941|nr:hypothetical protein [Arenimonas daejeonensis]